jgi:transcriptional regulator with XRE-family HTH domain
LLGVAYATTVGVMNEPEYRQVIAAEVRAAMARKRITQADLAGQMGIGRPTLSERLSGQRAFDTDQLIQISTILGVDFLSFFPETEAPVSA